VHQSFSPTILFVALVPRFLAIYQVLAKSLTAWENHAHFSTHAASLTLKTFALTALVAYLGLALSAFVYVPFGEGVMQIVQAWLFQETANGHLHGTTNATTTDGLTQEKVVGPTGGFWDMDTSNARHRLNPRRLRDQMFAYTVTNQIINTLTEVGLPFVLRRLAAFRNGKKGVSTPGSPGGKNGVKKRVVFEDEKEKGGMEEREFLDGVRREVALPEYELFGDYSEMVSQFGYVALWSTIWPLAPGMFLNLLNIVTLLT
jgi:anoctamin-10